MRNIALPFVMQYQTQSNWCWAANAASISIFYNKSSAATQCAVACVCLNRTDCCHGNVPACNVPFYLDRALKVVGNLRQFVGQYIDMSAIKTEIDNGRVIGTRIGWRNGGGHFVSLFGYNDLIPSNSYIYVADPIYGTSYMSLSDFTFNYLSEGSWTTTYFTKGHTMLHFKKLDEKIIEKAIAMMSPPSFGEFKESKSEETKSDMMGHAIFNIDMESLKGSGEVIFEQVGERLMDRDTVSKNNFIFEFANIDKKTNLNRIIYGDEYTKHYFNVFENLKKDSQKKKEDFKISVVRLPSLKVDAVWLEGIEGTSDEWFVPLFTNDFLKANDRYSKTEFYELLRKNAAETKFYDDDMLGG
ncbi:papain-like cysteine protease family protein [Flavobacterium sp.]|uniref:papain-like cysteine protease family protein n=1 Tax=Flavobacterium sp. TaxID=239 RepID=UPI003D6BE0D8